MQTGTSWEPEGGRVKGSFMHESTFWWMAINLAQHSVYTQVEPQGRTLPASALCSVKLSVTSAWKPQCPVFRSQPWGSSVWEVILLAEALVRSVLWGWQVWGHGACRVNVRLMEQIGNNSQLYWLHQGMELLLSLGWSRKGLGHLRTWITGGIGSTGEWLDSMSFKFFSNVSDSVILSFCWAKSSVWVMDEGLLCWS